MVIGVHSGKFRAERVTGNIAQAAQRLGVHHAVVNDRQYRIWRAYGVNAWPTVAIIDPEGGYVGAQPGEFLAEDVAPLLEGIIAESAASGRLSRAPLALTLPPEPQGVLRFPGKVLAVSRSRLFVADSGHDRILELAVDWGGAAQASPDAAAPQARVVRQIGSGRRGAADGALGRGPVRPPAGHGPGPRRRRRRAAVRGRQREPHHPRRRPDRRRGHHAGRHRRAGAAQQRARRRQVGRAQLALGRRAPRRRAHHRHGRVAPALAPRPGHAGRPRRGSAPAART